MPESREQDAVTARGRPKPLGAYPHVRRSGDLLFVSGTSARAPDDTVPGVSKDGDAVRLDIEVQTRAAIENVRAVLHTVGAELDDIVDVTTFLVDMGHFPGYNRVYGELLGTVGAARTTVAVAALPHPHLAIEMKVIARRRG